MGCLQSAAVHDPQIGQSAPDPDPVLVINRSVPSLHTQERPHHVAALRHRHAMKEDPRRAAEVKHGSLWTEAIEQSSPRTPPPRTPTRTPPTPSVSSIAAGDLHDVLSLESQSISDYWDGRGSGDRGDNDDNDNDDDNDDDDDDDDDDDYDDYPGQDDGYIDDSRVAWHRSMYRYMTRNVTILEMLRMMRRTDDDGK